MEILTMRVADIKGAAYNPRKKLKPGDAEFENIRRSIEEFSLVEPLIWNKQTETLVGGHQRLAVLKHLGHETVDVSVVDLDTAREKALNVALNKVAGVWDDGELRRVLGEAHDAGVLALTGFDEAEFQKTILNAAPYDIEELLKDLDVKKAVRKPIWVVIRAEETQKEQIEAALTLLNPANIKMEKNYVLETK